MIAYASGDHTVATTVSNPEFSAPFPAVNVDYILRQRFQQTLANFAPLALNTPHPDYTDYVLVSEGDKQDIRGLQCTWERVYAKVPASFSEPGGNYAYNFIGIWGSFGINVSTFTGRDRFTRNVPVKIVRDFFLVGAGQTYQTFEEIPAIAATRYLNSPTGDLDVDYIQDSPPLAVATSPNATQYRALIAADAADPDSYSIVVEDSRIDRWLGNIFMRETRYIKAI